MPRGLQRRVLPFLLLGAAALPACEATADASTSNADEHRPVYVDTVFPMDEEIRRFRELVGRTASEFDLSQPSRDALVERFVKAVEAADTTTLVRLGLDAAEFIDLYFPHTMYTAPPYELSPEVVWTLVQGSSQKGLTRILQRYAGQPLGFRGYRCDGAKTEGPNRIHDGCVLDIVAGGHAEPIRLFGSIIERDGRFALVSYANDL